MEIAPEVARWFREYYPLESDVVVADGWHRVELAAGSTRWAALLVLRLGAGVRNVSPDQIRDAAREVAGAIAARHR